MRAPFHAMPQVWVSGMNDQPIPLLQCPGDGQGGATKVVQGVTPPFSFTTSNYLGIFSGLDDTETQADAHPRRATFGINRGARIRDFQDGLSNTMTVAEYLTGVPLDSRGGFWTNRAGSQFLHVTNTPNSTTPDNLLDYIHFCPANNANGANVPANNLPCTAGPDGGNFASPRSRHSGGVHALLGDGSVKFVSENVNLTTWRNLAWIADRNPPGDY